MDSVDTQQLELLNQLQNNLLSNDQVFSLYVALSLPLPVSWRLAFYNFLTSLPEPFSSLTIEKTAFELMADEIDLLGLYLSRGIYFENGEFDKYTVTSFSGFSEEIDKYIFEKHETSLKPLKPHQISPDGFDEYLSAISKLNTSYRTDCIIRLLDLSYKGRENFVKSVESLKSRIKSEKN